LVQSAQTAGLRDDNTVRSATFFSESLLGGEAEVVTKDGVPSLTFSIQSFVTINTNIELFREENYEGDSFCLEIDPYFCKNEVCWLWQWEYGGNLPWDGSSAKSARIGCTAISKKFTAIYSGRHPGLPTIFSKNTLLLQ